MRHEHEDCGKIIKTAREACGLSQTKMAEIAGCSVRHYQNIETGEALPGYLIIYNIVNNLPISPHALFGLNCDDRQREQIEIISRILSTCNNEQLEIVRMLAECLRKANMEK